MALYGEVCDEVVEVPTAEAAELAKLLENIFRSVNIALVNELAGEVNQTMPHYCAGKVAHALNEHSKSIAARASRSSGCRTRPASVTCASRRP